MATKASYNASASSPSRSPPSANANSVLPPLVTNHPTRRTNTQRPTSYAKNRMSSYSSKSKASNVPDSRPMSHVFAIFHSSLPYTLVRDFAYPLAHPHHYGPPPSNSGLSTPASETRRSSDPAVSSWDENKGQWSATPPWTAENNASSTFSREQLPAMTFSDGGPPYSEDEDLHSPVVTTARHKKYKSASGTERGRSPGENRGSFVGLNGDGSETYYVNEGGYDAEEDGPGGELVTYPPDQARHSHLLASYQNPQYSRSVRAQNSRAYGRGESESEEEDDARFSRNYSFTIASPDEEMHGKAVALFDFTREHENELPLKEGQVILVSYRHGQGWLVAEDPKTGESGLVPEEFVRLVRDIEGGLNGLQGAQSQMDGLSIVPPVGNLGGTEMLSPTSTGPESAATPTHANPDWSKNHTPQPSNGGGQGEKLPAVQSSFSTSSKDLDPYPLHGVVGMEKEKGGVDVESE